MPPSGGCDFPVDPDLAAPSAPVFWNPADAPAVVLLTAPLPPVGIEPLPLTLPEVEARTDEAGLQWRRLGDGTVAVTSSNDATHAPLGVLIPFDDDWPIRVAAAERLRLRLIDRTVDPPLTPHRCKRIQHALHAIDARRAGATYRDLAVHFFGVARVAEEPWKTSSIKAQMARLATYGRALVARGYRDLLRGRSH